MPRGQAKPTGVRAGLLGRRTKAGLALAPPTEEEARAAIRRDLAAFARAWAKGDTGAMARRLHPDFVNRLMGLRGAGDTAPGGDPDRLVKSVMGLQATLGTKGGPARGEPEVRVLEVRPRSASAVADLGGWVLHAHLARDGRRWSIVNAMWEMVYGAAQAAGERGGA